MHSDIPIISIDEDLLNRGHFAENIAKTLYLKDTKPLIISLFGQWGEGKTSLLNLIEQSYKKIERANKLKIATNWLYFNPWNYGTKADLTEYFFNELSIVFGLDTELARKIRRLLPYALAFKSLLPTGNGFKNVMIPELQKSLRDLRNELDIAIRRTGKKVIVVIDDIDRLSHEEIVNVFKMIKMNADFPNFTYLLAFDRRIVEDALCEKNIPGAEYLEKIVQVGINIPPITSNQMEIYFDQIMEETLKKFDRDHVDPSQYDTFRHFGLIKLFSNLREAKRFVNSLDILSTGLENEVNVYEFVAIEALRQKFPELYSFLYKSRDALINQYFRNTEFDKRIRKEIELKLEGIPLENRETVGKLLGQLFPTLSDGYVTYDQKSFKIGEDLRIRHPRMFDKYFLYRLEDGQVSETTIRETLRNKLSTEKLDALLVSVKNDIGKYELFRSMYRYLDLVPQGNLPLIAAWAFPFIESMDKTKLDFPMDMGSAITLLVAESLESTPPESRTELVTDLIESDRMFPLGWILNRFLVAKSKGQSKMDDDVISQLQDGFIRKFQGLDPSVTLIDSVGFPFLLNLFKDLTKIQVAETKIGKNILNCPASFWAFICRFIPYDAPNDFILSQILFLNNMIPLTIIQEKINNVSIYKEFAAKNNDYKKCWDWLEENLPSVIDKITKMENEETTLK